jgi:DHA2 family multidrug resistance protein
MSAIRSPRHNPWLIAVVVAIAAFMEILDTSIANVALPHIAGNLGVSNDESTWVLTSYLVSNAVVLPASAWIAGAVGRKRFFMACIGFFTLSSLLCGVAPSLPFLLLFRVLQGLGGGGLQPMAQAILADTFPPQQRGLAFALYGITAVIAPAVGPTLGGWITYNYSLRWIFFINLHVGLIALLLDLAGPRAAGRLVRLNFHSVSRRHCRHRPGFARSVGVVCEEPHHRRSPFQEP